MATIPERAVSATPQPNNAIHLRDLYGNFVHSAGPLDKSHGIITQAYINGRYLVANTDRRKVAVFEINDNGVHQKSVQG